LKRKKKEKSQSKDAEEKEIEGGFSDRNVFVLVREKHREFQRCLETGGGK